MDDLYRDNILDHYHHPRHFGTLPAPTVRFEDNNPFCGDVISMELGIKKNAQQEAYIDEIAFQGKGCAISLASASLLTEHVQGKTIREVAAFTPQEVLDLLSVPLTPTRMKCALLSLEVLHKTIAHASSHPLAEASRDAV